jgi:hypothetical protein
VEPTNTPVRATAAETEGILFQDDFNLGLKSEWQPVVGEWRMANGKLTGKGERFDWAYIVAGDPTWSNYAVELDTDHSSDSWQAIAVLVRVQDLGNLVTYILEIDGTGTGWYVTRDGERDRMTRESSPDGTKHQVRVEARGNLYVAYVDGQKASSASDPTFSSGRIGVGIRCRSDTCNTVDNIKVIPLD